MSIFLPNLNAQAKMCLSIVNERNIKSYATGALLEIVRDKVKLTATDGFVLFTSEVNNDNDGLMPGQELSLFINILTLKYLAKSKKNLRYDHDDGEFTGDGFLSKPSSANFPNYKTVLEPSRPVLTGQKFDPKYLGLLPGMGSLKSPAKIRITESGLLVESDIGTLIICSLVVNQ